MGWAFGIGHGAITTAFLRKPFTLQLKTNFLNNPRIGTMPSGEFLSGDGLPIQAASTMSSATPSSLRTIFKKYNMHILFRLFTPKVDPRGYKAVGSSYPVIHFSSKNNRQEIGDCIGLIETFSIRC